MSKMIPQAEASEYGFSSKRSGTENAAALNRAAAECETVTVSPAGIYNIAGTVRLPSDTHLVFADGVVLRRVPLKNKFLEGNLFVNAGAFNGTFNENISIRGAHIVVNGVESATISSDDDGKTILKTPNVITGLRGHIAFLYVKHVLLEDILITDLMAKDYGIQVSDFEDVTIRRVHIEGLKDGVHFGPGRHFILRDGKFRTFDDAIALNCADYSVSNPNFGSISDGLIENCVELPGYGNALFIRILVGTARKWQKGMTVYHSDAVLTDSGMYRVVMKPDNTPYVSDTEPRFEEAYRELDGILWIKTHKGYAPHAIPATAGCRNILCRNIMLEQPRSCAVRIYRNNDAYLRSWYPGCEMPEADNIRFEDIKILKPVDTFLSVETEAANVRVD